VIDFPHSIKKRFVVFGKGLVSLSLVFLFCPWIPAQPFGRETSKPAGEDWKLISLETR